jgi:acyl dehydratase
MSTDERTRQGEPIFPVIDRQFAGRRIPARRVAIERGQVDLFCKAIGEANRIYHDEDAARAAGLPAIPAPPTFGFTLKALTGQPFNYLSAMGVDNRRLLHGKQELEHRSPLYVGDVIEVATIIQGIENTSGGRFTSIATRTDLLGPVGDLRVRLTAVWLVRNESRHAS